MTSLYLANQVRELDRIAIEEEGIPGLVLMRRAAEACVGALFDWIPSPARVSVLCGSGNNAGDGFIIAGLLRNRGIKVTVGLVGKLPSPGTDAGSAYAFCRESGVEIITAELSLKGADVVVDALLGTGISGAVRPEYHEIISAVNQSDAAVLAVDLPSGLCADTGNILGACIKAGLTVTFIGRKTGLLTNDGPEVTGKLVFDDLSVPQSVYEAVGKPAAQLLTYEEQVLSLPVRNRNAHKRSHGHVLVFGGNKGMAGAVAMAAEAAMYAGAGLVSVATHPSSVDALITRRPEIMTRGVTSVQELQAMLARATVVVAGPGLGTSGDWGADLFDCILDCGLPMIVDADGLNRLSASEMRADNWILTPHPGEARSLLGTDVQANRLESVRALQEKYGGVSLLKGAGTLVKGPDTIWLCPYGNPGMSVAGMGDVLSGVLGGLLAQGLDLEATTRLGAVVHSLAADNIVARQGERGLLASELLPEIRRLLNPDRCPDC